MLVGRDRGVPGAGEAARSLLQGDRPQLPEVDAVRLTSQACGHMKAVLRTRLVGSVQLSLGACELPCRHHRQALEQAEECHPVFLLVLKCAIRPDVSLMWDPHHPPPGQS